jgi:putative PEP-CTERM system TPR-repeat lipoprotein
MYLSAVLAATPENARARRLLAETRLALKKDQEARQALEPLTSGPGADPVSLSMAAGASLNLGEIEEAVALLVQGIKADPGNVDLKVQLALAYFRNRQFDESREVLDSLPDMSGERNEFRSGVLRVLATLGQGEQSAALAEARSLRENWPERAEAYSLVGSIEVAAGNLEAARDSFLRGLDVAPEDVRILRSLAELDIADGDPEAARERYSVILELEPGDARSMVSLARLAARSEKHDEARDWLEKARRAAPGSVSARSLLAAHYLDFRDFRAAVSVATEAVNLDPDNPKLLNLLGLAQLYSQNYRDAEFSLGKAVDRDPDEPTYRLSLARAQAARGNVSSAIVSLEESPGDELQHLPTGLTLAKLHADSGDLERAQQIASRLVEIHPDDSAPLALQAEFLVRGGDLVAAAETYDKALDLAMVGRFAVRAYQIRRQAGLADQVEPLLRFLEVRPLDSAMRLFLADAYNNLGQIDNANDQYDEVLRQDPNNFIAANNLAWNYFQSGDNRAESLARRAFELRPDSGVVADTLGSILVRSGNLEEGISTLRSAVELSDGRIEIRYHLAAALAKAGEVEEARAILRELLQSGEVFADKQAAEALLAGLE